ncbi:MAG: hypothetical protein QXE21_05215, partial [Candidatus Korarchaeota archaeon]
MNIISIILELPAKNLIKQGISPQAFGFSSITIDLQKIAASSFGIKKICFVYELVIIFSLS